MEVANDIAYTMEILRMNFKLVFGFRKRIPKLTVNVTANRQEFREQWPGPGQMALGFYTSGQICTFYQPRMTTSVLMHEGTHEILRRFAPTCPRWLHEGLAQRMEGRTLSPGDEIVVTNLDHDANISPWLAAAPRFICTARPRGDRISVTSGGTSLGVPSVLPPSTTMISSWWPSTDVRLSRVTGRVASAL